jgi:hypothetical protein
MRSSYVNGCRCSICRAANTEYCKTRRKTGLSKEREVSVDASRARDYLITLSEAGMGRLSVHKACGVSQRILWEIATGKKARILCSTQARILAVKPDQSMPRGVLVDADVTRQQIEELLANGFTKKTLAVRLHHHQNRARLRILEGDKVRASSALNVNNLYQLTMSEEGRGEGIFDAA